MGLKVDIGTLKLAETQWSCAEEEYSNLSSGLSQLVMNTKEMEDRVHVTLLETSSSLFSSCSCSDGDGVGECVVCLRKFHGGEKIHSQSCGHVFNKTCVDKWILD
jgi:hypothetical protein